MVVLSFFFREGEGERYAEAGREGVDVCCDSRPTCSYLATVTHRHTHTRAHTHTTCIVGAVSHPPCLPPVSCVVVVLLFV